MEDYNKVLQIQDRFNPSSRPRKEKRNRQKKEKKIPSFIKKWQFWVAILWIYGLSLCGSALKITISDIELPSIAHNPIVQEEIVLKEVIRIEDTNFEEKEEIKEKFSFYSIIEQEIDVEDSKEIVIIEQTETESEEVDTEIVIKNSNNFNIYDNVEQQQTEDAFVLNTDSHKIHYPHCRDVPKIAPQNYSTSNENLETLLNQGYSRCGHCFR